MPDFNVRSDSVNVEQIMEQIRARIREKRGVDYTEQQIRELAAVKLEKFLDPKGVRSDLLEEFRRVQTASERAAPPNYAFGEETLFETHRGGLRFLRRLLMPLLKLFFNPNPLIQALNIQSELNTINAQRETARRGLDQLHFEVLHNLVLETTRMSIELKNLKMRVESLGGRLDFNERRARALESVVAYRPAAEDRMERMPAQVASVSSGGHSGGHQRSASIPASLPPGAPAAPPPPGPLGPPAAFGGAVSESPQQATPAGSDGPGNMEGPGQRSRRRRRRRGRRGSGSAVQLMGGQVAGASLPAPGGAESAGAAVPQHGPATDPESAASGPSPSTLREPQGPEDGRGTTGSGQSEDQ
jgi:hypothetical protein